VENCWDRELVCTGLFFNLGWVFSNFFPYFSKLKQLGLGYMNETQVLKRKRKKKKIETSFLSASTTATLPFTLVSLFLSCGSSVLVTSSSVSAQ